MREIKFRAFNKAERKMCRVVSIDFTGFITVRFPEFEHESDDYNDQMLIEEFEPLMQFTGLKDKNCREIYEGDLLQHPNGTIAEIQYSDDLAAFVAVYVQNSNTEMDYLDEEIVSKCKIVGNIYEDKHLLGG